MKTLIILAALLIVLALSLACAVEGPAVDIPAGGLNQAGAAVPAAGDNQAAQEKPTAEPGAAVHPLTIRDAYLGGMDSLLREVHFPLNGRVLVAAPQTAAADLDCDPLYPSGAGCNVSFPDPAAAQSLWWASFNFAEVESAISFRESLGQGPVTVSCILSDQSRFSDSASFHSCEERGSLSESAFSALVPLPTATLPPPVRAVRVEAPVGVSGSGSGGYKDEIWWRYSPQEGRRVHFSAGAVRRDSWDGGWLVCAGSRVVSLDSGGIFVYYDDCVPEEGN